MKKSEETRLRKLSEKVLNFLGYKNAEAGVFLIDGNLMKKMNWRFRGKKSTTNILSFEYPAGFPCPKSIPRPLGDVYLNPGYIKRHKEDIDYLLIHGVLHLAGFDHMKKSDRMRMESLEKKLLWHKTKFWD